MLNHFKANHSRTKGGKFVVPLPKQTDARLIGESRSQAVRRFLSLERSLNSKNQFKNFEFVMSKKIHGSGTHRTYPKCRCWEAWIPSLLLTDAHSLQELKYHHKDKSSFRRFSKICHWRVFKWPPTSRTYCRSHPQRCSLALLTSSSCCHSWCQMYRAVELVSSDRDLHRFVWRSIPSDVTVWHVSHLEWLHHLLSPIYQSTECNWLC